MEVEQGAPVGPVSFTSPARQEMLQHVVVEAQRLGLEVNMNNDALWRGRGGPWIQPEQSPEEIVGTEWKIALPVHF